MARGKHVLTEKLMAHNVGQCKAMARYAKETGLHLATGHQRHYSVLYDNAVHLIRYGLLGQLHHIRAQWHRGNLPGNDSWSMPLPGGEVAMVNGKEVKVNKIADQLKSFRNQLEAATDPIELQQLERKLLSGAVGSRSRNRRKNSWLRRQSPSEPRTNGDGRTVPLAIVGANWRRLDGGTR
jgi:hypothetical protein